MKRVEIVDPRGRKWVVALRWLPWSPKWRGKRPSRATTKDDAISGRDEEDDTWWDWLINFGDLLSVLDEGFGAFVTILAVVVALVAFIFLIFPLFVS
jgi:hypothetical protein